MVTMMILELYRFDEISLHQQLKGLVAKAPRFFENTPIVVGLEHLYNSDGPVDLPRLCTLCSTFGINLIAIRGGNSQHRRSASDAGLACLSAQPQAAARKLPAQDPLLSAEPLTEQDEQPLSLTTSRKPRAFVKTPATFKSSKVTPIHQNELSLKLSLEGTDQLTPAQLYVPPRVISTPIRSGQQVYHTGDLILTGPVSPGAEVLATGSIHAYGPLRGRALAGVNGNDKARIYCTQFEAELVSIHGHYKLSAAIEKKLWGKSVQIHLDEDSLILEPL